MLLPVLLKERLHAQRPYLIRRTLEMSVRVTCGGSSYTFLCFTCQSNTRMDRCMRHYTFRANLVVSNLRSGIM